MMVEMNYYFLNETNERNFLFKNLILQNTQLFPYKYNFMKA
jgi:hypothetical protein